MCQNLSTMSANSGELISQFVILGEELLFVSNLVGDIAGEQVTQETLRLCRRPGEELPREGQLPRQDLIAERDSTELNPTGGGVEMDRACMPFVKISRILNFHICPHISEDVDEIQFQTIDEPYSVFCDSKEMIVAVFA